MHLLRLVIAGVAARQNFSVDVIDDLRLAVDETGSYLLSLGAKPNHLNMRLNSDSDAVVALLWIDAKQAQWPPRPQDQGLWWQILIALTDEAEFLLEDGAPAIRFVKRDPLDFGPT